jgi:hypothetical protein
VRNGVRCLARDVEGVVEQGARFAAAAAVEGDFGQALQGEVGLNSLIGRFAEPGVQAGARHGWR